MPRRLIEKVRPELAIRDKKCVNCGKLMPRYKQLFCSDKCGRKFNSKK